MNEPLILLHGALGTKAQLNPLKEKLSSKFEVHTFDFEGHGEPGNKPFSMHLFVDNVLEYMRNNSMDTAHMFGYSMGGYVALNLALKHPDKADKIITLGTKFDWTMASAEKEVKMLDAEKIAVKVPAFASHLSALHGKSNWKDVAQKTAQMMLNLGAGERLNGEDLERIDHKVLIAIGDRDHMVSVEESTSSAHRLANGTLKIIPDVPHPIEKVDTDVLKSVIIDFID